MFQKATKQVQGRVKNYKKRKLLRYMMCIRKANILQKTVTSNEV